MGKLFTSQIMATQIIIMLLFHNENMFWNNCGIHLLPSVSVNGFGGCKKSKKSKSTPVEYQPFFRGHAQKADAKYV